MRTQSGRTESDVRVEALLAGMTLAEKVAQLSCGGRAYEMADLLNDEGALDVDAFIARFPHGVGQIGRINVDRSGPDATRLAAAIQRVLTEHTRTGIGALANEEGVHGLMGRGASVFPAALALAATWDDDLVERVYTAVAAETRARGGNYVYAPVLDLARDARWGRAEETFGEDPVLVSQLGVAAVHGLQGRVAPGAPIASDRVAACAKHFVGHGVPQSGNNGGPVQLGERELRDDHLPPFAAAVDAGVAAVMAAYHERDGIPVHADAEWLTGVLRCELGFAGVVTSDGFGVPQLATLHRVASDAGAAAEIAFVAGVDCEVPEPVGAAGLVAAVEVGRLPPAVVDRATRRVLELKHRLGLLDPLNPESLPSPPERAAHCRLATEAARRALVLLTNRETLPLDPSVVGSILVTGPNAEHAHLGGYTDRSADGVSVLDGMRARFGSHTVRFTEGCRITDGRTGPATWWEHAVSMADPAADDDRIAEAVAAAQEVDVAVVVIGGNEATHREGWWFDHLGDRSRLTMHGRQDELVERIAATGKRTVAVVISGGAVDLRRVAAVADAVLWTCYPGEDGGSAIAEVLAGDHAPGGHLPITFPRSTGQVPMYTGQHSSARRGYLDESGRPLFELGHGLGYTTFDTSVVSVSPDAVDIEALTAGATFDVTIDIANIGHREGVELVRLAIDDPLASVARARDRLRAFRRVVLVAGQTARVVLSVGWADLSLLDRTMTRIVEPGRFTLVVQTSTGTSRHTVTVEPAGGGLGGAGSVSP
ncbi:glycoside hydrolase family 3 N-terminal domain-containing protein [soil metagenome]